MQVYITTTKGDGNGRPELISFQNIKMVSATDNRFVVFVTVPPYSIEYKMADIISVRLVNG